MVHASVRFTGRVQIVSLKPNDMNKSIKQLAEIAYKETVEQQGSSTNIQLRKPLIGYMVSIFGHEQRINITDLTVEDIEKYIASKIALLSDRKFYLGTWVLDDVVYLDVSRHYFNSDDAIAAGRSGNQVCIWDVLNQKEIYWLKEDELSNL